MSKEPNTPLAKNVRDVRKKKHWSQEKLAEKANLSRNTIYNLEHDSEITADSLLAVSKALGVSVDVLSENNVLLDYQTSEEAEIIRLLRSLSDEDRSGACQILKIYCQKCAL